MLCPHPSISDKWNALPSGAKLAVYASAGGVGGLLLILAIVYCIRQRRRGAREAKFAELKADEERRELDAFKKAGINPDSFREEATEYNARNWRATESRTATATVCRTLRQDIPPAPTPLEPEQLSSEPERPELGPEPCEAQCPSSMIRRARASLAPAPTADPARIATCTTPRPSA